jgi:hypothetical protein
MKFTFDFPLVIALVLYVSGLAVGQPGEKMDSPPLEDFIEFTTVQTLVDCGELGGPATWETYRSPEATIVVSASRGLKVDYLTGADLTNGVERLPTVFQFALKGAGTFDGDVFDGQHYSSYFNRNPSWQGQIVFAPTSPDFAQGIFAQGIKARVVAQRRGLNDSAGKYTTEILLRWYKF